MLEKLTQKICEAVGSKKPSDLAVLCRSVVREELSSVYDRLGAAMPERASLLELLEDPAVGDFLGNPQLLQELDQVRIIGSNAEHGRTVKKRQATWAAETCEAFVETVEAKLAGRPAVLKPHTLSEAETRKQYIDVLLNEAGWDVLEEDGAALPGKAGIEIPVVGMPNSTGEGFCDYVLYGRDLKPLAVVEAKKTSAEPERGHQQVKLYGDCMKARYGYVPILYYTNGYQIWCVDGFYPARRVRAFHTLDELTRLIQKRGRGPLAGISAKVNPDIAGRDYQITAVTAICEKFGAKKRGGLLVMATGTGKTRTVISLVDILSRENWITNVLFLADRTSLVTQAHDAFKDLLPAYPRSVISDATLSGPGSESARIVFSTYQTMINKIDGEAKEFSSGRFDLIVVDEAHRSIFNKYGAIFDYFDALLVGLTATPRGEVDRNTFQRFSCESDVPDFDYTMDQGFKDRVLVPYRVLSRTTDVLSRGIAYAQRSAEERRQMDEAYDDEPPDRIEHQQIFKSVFNIDTVDKVIREVMERALKVDGGERIGKTVIFAYNHRHAQLIWDRFRDLYPHDDDWCQVVDNHINYAESLVRKFKTDDKFRIAISVDMLDTGIDVPEILNLVFFKPVRSKIKFTQMIGRGTRPCKNVFAPGKDKREFYIFDYCANFKFFGEHRNEIEPVRTLSVSQRIFATRVGILGELQKARNRMTKFDRDYHAELMSFLHGEVAALKADAKRIQVRENLPHVDAFATPASWCDISEVQQSEINRYVTPLVEPKEDEHILTKFFDARMLRIELAILKSGGLTKKVQGDVEAVTEVAETLLKKCSIPEVEAHEEDIASIADKLFWMSPSVQAVETWRRKLRGIAPYAQMPGKEKIYLNVHDEILEGDRVDPNLVYRSYRQKVIDYLSENWHLPVVNKIRRLERITDADMKELEDILWNKLGTHADYDGEEYAGSLAGFVRSLTGLDQEAVNEKFGAYLTGNVFNAKQQEFVKVVISYVRENGEITRDDLVNAFPFNLMHPVQLFGEKMPLLQRIISTLEQLLPTAA